MSLPETSNLGASDTLCTTELFDALKMVKKYLIGQCGEAPDMKSRFKTLLGS